MDTKVNNALESLFNTFSALENVPGQQELQQLQNIFAGDEDFMTKLMLMDKVFDDAP